MTGPAALAVPTPQEWRARIYFHRIDELGEFAPTTDLQAVIAQFEGCTDKAARSAIACLIGSLHIMASEFADAQHWLQIAIGQAPGSTWVSTRANAVYANELLWNGDVALAASMFADAEPVDHPFSDFSMRVVSARIAFAQGDFARVAQLLEGIVPDPDGDPLGVGADYVAIFESSMALADGGLADAEVILRRALLTSSPGTRSNALLLERLGRIMARCGLPRETMACQRAAREGLARWPSEASGSNRGFELLTSALGLRRRTATDRRGRAWPTVTADSGQRIVDLQRTAEEQLSEGDRIAARHSIEKLISTLAEHTRSFEAMEARALAASTLADIPTLAVGLGLLGDAADALRVTQAAFRVVLADQTRGDPSTERIAKLRELARATRELDPSLVNRMELADLDQRIRRLDRRARSLGPSIDGTDWLDRPLPSNRIVFFEQAKGRLWRVTSFHGSSEIVDLGPISELERSARSFKLAAAALALDHPDGERRLIDAAESLDGQLLGDCDWQDAEPVTLVPGRALAGLPWRKLPTMRRVRLELAIADEVAAVRGPFVGPRVLVIGGPGSDARLLQELRSITMDYAESRIVSEPSLNPGQLVDHCRSADVVHVAGHGRLERVPVRGEEPVDEIGAGPAEPMLISHSAAPMAHTVVLSSTDATLNRDLGRDGLTWSLLGNGVDHVIASTIDLDEGATGVVMPVLHQLLASGIGPAEALHSLRFDDMHAQAAADSLLCYSIKAQR